MSFAVVSSPETSLGFRGSGLLHVTQSDLPQGENPASVWYVLLSELERAGFGPLASRNQGLEDLQAMTSIRGADLEVSHPVVA